MKKLSLFIAIALLPFLGQSQSIFDKFEDLDKVTSLTVNKGLIKLAGNMAAFDKDNQEAQDFAEISKGITGIKVFVTEDFDISSDMQKTVKRYLKSSSMEELMRVKDKDANVKFYIRQGRDEDHVRELLLFVSDINHDHIEIGNRKFESVLVTVTGDIDLNKIAALTNQMNLPEELNEAGK